MKRLFDWMVAVILILSAVCGAMAEGETFKTPYFTMQLPDGWVTDYEDLQKEEGMECLGYFGENADIGFVACAYLVYYEGLKDLALWSSDAEEIQAYIEATLEDLADDNPVYLDTVMAGKIPIVLVKATDKDGEYLYADTMTNGYAIQIRAFVIDDSEEEKIYPLTEENIEQFKTILATFQPVT